MEKIGTELRKEATELRDEVRGSVLNYISAGLGFVVGLAWNNAISGLIKYFFPSVGSGILAGFVYAAFLTVVATFLIVYLGKLLKKRDVQKR